MNSFAVLQALIFEPKKAFAELAERPKVAFPILLLIVASVVTLFWYFSVVDGAWLIDQTLRARSGARELTEEQIKQAAAVMTPAVIKWSSILGAPIGVLLVRLLEALYFLLAGKITGVQRSYKQWLSLASWSSLPSVLAVIPAAIVLATTTSNQIDQGQLQALSLNSLFFHRSLGDPGYSLLISVNLLQFVGLYLAAAGVRAWSGRSMLFSTVFAALPWALIVGVWAFIALGRS
jgi:hypothetical protein